MAVGTAMDALREAFIKKHFRLSTGTLRRRAGSHGSRVLRQPRADLRACALSWSQSYEAFSRSQRRKAFDSDSESDSQE